MFSKLVIAAFASIAARPAVASPQLGGLPTSVCLLSSDIAPSTPALSLPTLPEGLSVVECPTGETCTAFDIPILGALLPIGVSSVFRFGYSKTLLISLIGMHRDCLRLEYIAVNLLQM